MPRAHGQTDKPSTTDELSWDGSPLTRFAWQKELPRRLTRANPAYRTLCEYGYVLDRGKVYCASPTHMLHIFHNNVARQSIQKPCLILNFKHINASLVPPAIPEEAATRYVVAPEVLHATDTRLFEEITESISNPKRRDDYYHLSSGSGLQLLRILTDELADQSPEIGAWAAGEIAALQLAGIASPTVAAFDAYRDKYEDLNGQLDEQASDASLAAHYFAQVRRLGDMLATKLKLRMTTDYASGDLPKTVAAITAVLNEEEASSGTGRALYSARDPHPQRGAKGKVKSKSTPEKRTWIADKDELCTVCNGEIDGGRHLRKDCPKRDSTSTRPTSGGRGGARAATSYPRLSDYDGDDAIILDDTDLAKAFEDGLPTEFSTDARIHDNIAERTAASHIGTAHVVRPTAEARANQGNDETAPGASLAPPTTPPQPDSTRSSVERLDTNSPVAEMRAIARELRTPINLSVGGNARRTKVDILQDLRAAVGLVPLEPPLGIAVSPPPAQHPDACDNASKTPATTDGATSSRTSGSTPQTAPPTAALMSPPYGIGKVTASYSDWPWQGGPPRVLVCTVADGHGGALLQHTFATSWSGLRDAAPSVFTSPLDGPNRVDKPPAGSVWLGSRPTDGMRLWGQRDGTLVCNHPMTNDAHSGAGQPTPPTSARDDVDLVPSPTTGLTASSLAAVLVAFGVFLSLRSDSDMAPALSPPHDSGAHARELACPCLVCIWALHVLIGSVVRQANRMAQRGRRQLLACNKHKYKPAPPNCATRHNPFSVAASSSRRSLLDALRNFYPPWLLSFLAVQCILLHILGAMGYVLRLHVSANQLPRYALHHFPLPTASRRALLSALLNVHPGVAFVPLASAVRWARGDSGYVVASYIVFVTLLFLAAHVLAFAPSLVGALSHRRGAKSVPAPHEGPPPVAPAVRAGDSSLASAGDPLLACARRGRAALSSRASTHSTHKGWRSRFNVSHWLSLVVDSGCTWHIHNNKDDFLNLRPCNDIVVDAHGKEARCQLMGDLPLVVRDARGREFTLLLRGVRLAEHFSDTLISVDQLWATSGIDTIFRDVRQLVFTRNAGLSVPFRRVNGSYTWEVGVLQPSAASATAWRAAAARSATERRDFCAKGEIHAAGAQSHIHALPADGVAALLHRRLHVGIDHIRRLGKHSIDAPAHVTSASRVSCDGCSEANAVHLSHPSSRYQPSHVGRLIHADIVGPFVTSYAGSYKYGLILVDDHSRYKTFKPLRAKSDAPAAVRSFVAELNAGVSTRSVTPVRVVGTLHTDNAGEFISKEFEELLDLELVAHTTCPPHVHQLNGVAERAIRSVTSLARAYLAFSRLGVQHWPAAFDMAVDVLNRTSGPPNAAPGGGPSSYEVLTGVPPRIMDIMPFGCRAFVVKPRSQYSKTTLDPRAWVGVNLGKCPATPGAYRIFVPSTGRVVVASDVYFLESFFPCRPRGMQLDDSAPPIPMPAPAECARAAVARARSALSEAFSSSVSRSCPSRRVLLLFSGPRSRPDGMAAFFAARGVAVDQVDSRLVDGGGEAHDILNESFFSQLLKSVRSGTYGVVFAEPPCSTYSVSRYFPPKSHSHGPPPVRSRKHILGLPSVPAAHRLELRRANEITRRTAILLMAAHRSGAEFILENPVDRGDPSHPLLFQFVDHGPIWLDPFMQELSRACSTESSTFAQCMFGAAHQKYTTLWYTAGLAPAFRPLRQLVCTHAPGAHASAAGGVKDLSDLHWNSEASSAYPADFNLL